MLTGCGERLAAATTSDATSGVTPPVCSQASAATADRASVVAGIIASPLYAAVAQGRTARCSAEQAGSVETLRFTFGGMASVRVTLDTTIEYREDLARFDAAVAADPVALLTQAERERFGDDGCGIDWRQSPEASAASDAPGSTLRTYRGEVCNCQARQRRDAAGRLVELGLRSAC